MRIARGTEVYILLTQKLIRSTEVYLQVPFRLCNLTTPIFYFILKDTPVIRVQSCA